jgi:hypothetical protein
LREIILSAATGKVPAGMEAKKKEYESHAQTWFLEWGNGVRILIDTQYVLWSALAPSRIAPWVRKLVVDLDNEM